MSRVAFVKFMIFFNFRGRFVVREIFHWMNEL